MKKLLLSALMLASISSFGQTRKVLMEDYTGMQCGWCPEGTVILEELHSTDPEYCLPVAIHGGSFEYAGSPLRSKFADDMFAAFSITSFPSGGINRVKFQGEAKMPVGRGSWKTYYPKEKANPAIVSIGFANKKYDENTQEYTADVNIKFTSLPTGLVRLQVIAIEDSIAATGKYEQDNYSKNVQGGASPLKNWYHNRTFRAAFAGTDWTGDKNTVPASPVVDSVYTYKLKFKMDAAWNPAQVHIVAYLTNYTSSDKSVLNAEEWHGVITSSYKTSVNNVNQSISVESIYPSPASVNQMLNIQYNTKETSNVAMKVYSAMGQLVAQPYNSYEVAGSHIINWTPAKDGLAPGIYLVELTTNSGRMVQRVVLQ